MGAHAKKIKFPKGHHGQGCQKSAGAADVVVPTDRIVQAAEPNGTAVTADGDGRVMIAGAVVASGDGGRAVHIETADDPRVQQITAAASSSIQASATGTAVGMDPRA